MYKVSLQNSLLGLKIIVNLVIYHLTIMQGGDNSG